MGERFQIGDHWLSKRPGSDRWCRTWFCRESRQTRRQSLGTADFREAQLRLAEWVTLNQAPQKAADLPLAQVLVRYFENHAKHTRSGDAIKYRLRHWSEFWGEAMVSEVTKSEQQRFLRHLKAKGLQDGYIQLIFTAGRAAVNYAQDNGELVDVPRIMYVPAAAPEARVLTPEEGKALIDAVESEHGMMYFQLAFNTWARQEAILECTSFQVRIPERIIQLNPPGRAQTKKVRPVVPITDTLLPFVKDAPGGYLVNWHGKRIRSVKTLIRDTAARAKIGKINSRTIRHTMATWARDQDVPWHEIEAMLGHRIPSTSEKYARWNPKHDGPAAKATDLFMRGGKVIEDGKEETNTQLTRTDPRKPHSFVVKDDCLGR